MTPPSPSPEAMALVAKLHKQRCRHTEDDCEVGCRHSVLDPAACDECLALALDSFAQTAREQERRNCYDTDWCQRCAALLPGPWPKYDAKHGDEKACGVPTCGHRYYRHFDTYDEMAAVGCKVCGCHTYVEESHGR